LKFLTRKRTQPINYANVFCLWHIYRAIGEDVPSGGYEEDENYPVTTRHIAIKSPYATEPIKTEKRRIR